MLLLLVGGKTLYTEEQTGICQALTTTFEFSVGFFFIKRQFSPLSPERKARKIKNTSSQKVLYFPSPFFILSSISSHFSHPSPSAFPPFFLQQRQMGKIKGEGDDNWKLVLDKIWKKEK